MNGRTLILSLLALVGLFLCSKNRSADHQDFIVTPAHTQWVDGGSPRPPLPPVSATKTLTADGGSPRPPLPPSIMGIFDSGAA